jgi:uncharacterized protein YjbJ (UPF0337 family)
MNEAHVKGAADHETKEAAGRVTGNKKLETQGKVDQVKGAIHNAAGNAKTLAKRPSTA